MTLQVSLSSSVWDHVWEGSSTAIGRQGLDVGKILDFAAFAYDHGEELNAQASCGSTV